MSSTRSQQYKHRKPNNQATQKHRQEDEAYGDNVQAHQNKYAKNGFKPQAPRGFTYVRKVDTLEGQQQLKQQQHQQQQELLQQQQQREQEEAAFRTQEEERMRQKQWEVEEQLRQERVAAAIKAAEINQIAREVMSNMIAQIEARAHFQTSHGLSYLLGSNFSSVSSSISNSTTSEILEFNARKYVTVNDAAGFKRGSHNNQHGGKHSQANHNHNHHGQQNRQSQNGFQNQNQTGVQQVYQKKASTSNKSQQQQNADGDSWRGLRGKSSSTSSGAFSLGKDELKFLLNVLTPENFEKLKEQFYVLCCADVDKCIRHLVNKVCKEAKYTKLYCNLAVYVKTREEQTEAQAKQSGAAQKGSSASNQFRTKMLESLSGFFYDEQTLLAVLGKKEGNSNSSQHGNSQDDVSMDDILQKKRFQNFLRFLGELFMAKFMPKKVISYCIQTMLQQYVAGGMQADDKHIEGIIALMDSIGCEFEAAWKNYNSGKQNQTDFTILQEISNQLLEKDEQFDNDLFESEFISFRGVMNILVFLAGQKRVSIRIKSLITNLLHRWNNRWQQALHQMETPKTLNQIQEEHYNEMQKRSNEAHGVKNVGDKRSASRMNTTSNTNGVAAAATSSKQSVDYEQEAKRILKELDQAVVECEEAVEQVRVIGVEKMVEGILSEFFNARLDQVRGRRSGFVNLLLMTEETIQLGGKFVVNAMNSVLSKMCSQACDFPNIVDNFAGIICPLVMAATFELKELIAIPTGDQDVDEDRTYFFNEIQSECLTQLRAQNQFMHARV